MMTMKDVMLQDATVTEGASSMFEVLIATAITCGLMAFLGIGFVAWEWGKFIASTVWEEHRRGR